MQTTYIGQLAEQRAAEFLGRHGYHVVVRNWRRRQCEIDIVAIKQAVAHIVEVKYRQSDTAGDGLEYVTPQKLRQMEYAASRWVAENNWQGGYVLSAIEVSGRDFAVTAFIASIDM